MDNIQEYIGNYVSNDMAIRFNWNGRHSNEFEDRNYQFRRLVIKQVLQQSDIAPLSLLRDLFRAETLFAKETWCVNRCVSALASLMLTRGKIKVIDDFIDGRYRSFDTYCECSRINISAVLAEEIRAELLRRLTAGTDTSSREVLQSQIDFFAWLAKKSEA